jgi:threonine dehydrogenase-like Zn-dependent dehydrogenase
VPGHEFVGVVLESEDPFWQGRRVVADINAGCAHCEDCLAGNSHHCAERTVLGIVGRSGAFAEQLMIPERCLVAVPDSVRDEQAVFAEPLAAALHVLDVLPPANEGRARLAVLGDGKLGLLTALALAAEGHETTLIGHHEAKLSLAAACGIGTCLERDLGETKYDLVVEATGNPRGLERAIELTRARGTVVLKTTVGDKHSLDLAPVVINELTLVGSRCGNMRQAIELLQGGAIDPSPLIEAHYDLANADQAFAHASRAGALKVLIRGHAQP